MKNIPIIHHMLALGAFAVFAVVAALFSIGYAAATYRMTEPQAVMEQYVSWSVADQEDFVRVALRDHSDLRREIAEDWCAINSNTMRVCRNARLALPVGR